MYWKYSIGFLIASLVQAALIITAEYLNISNLGAKLTPMQLTTHILAGQFAGFILLWFMKAFSLIRETSIWVIGSIYGILVWAIILTINSIQGTVNAPWNEGVFTVLSSILAFIVFGLISAYTIKKYEDTFSKV